MTTCLPSVHTIPQPTTTKFPSLFGMSRHKSSLAASYASYVVRVHTRHGIKTLSFDVLAAFFTFTAKKAAEDLGISSRTLIRVCRSLGIRRWPYLGFRSEKNVERIRQEAMENLRRKLEREGESSPTAVPHPNASSLRGASAKRLLQVKLPKLALPSLQNAPPHQASPMRSNSWCSSQAFSATAAIISDDDERMSDTDSSESRPAASMEVHATTIFSSPHSVPAPLMTPPPTTHGFNLDLQVISPNKMASIPQLTMNPQAHSSASWIKPNISGRLVADKHMPLAMPSLNLLVDASILTAFKHDMESQLTKNESSTNTHQPHQLFHHPRTMSMQDILALKR
ncbi:hypothetical protein BBJ28_00020231 [Nothophytophthora sp. Chile5]|nr:hypothetical protein BBJ28_00020231 [Nothophytophthora sp. Chile5]